MKIQNRLGGGQSLPPEMEDYILKALTQGQPGKFGLSGPQQNMTNLSRGYPSFSSGGPGQFNPGLDLYGPSGPDMPVQVAARTNHPLPPQRPPGLGDPFPGAEQPQPALPPTASAYAPVGGPPARSAPPPPAGQGAHPLPPERPPGLLPMPNGMASQNAADFSGLLAGAQTGPQMGGLLGMNPHGENLATTSHDAGMGDLSWLQRLQMPFFGFGA